MAEQRSDLHQLALQALKGVHEQREEILRAFVAKYRCQPDDAVQAMQTTVEGDRHVTRYWIEKSRRMPVSPAPTPAEGEVAELVAALSSRDRWMQLTDAQVDRAAALLEQQQERIAELEAELEAERLRLKPVPVAVSDGLPTGDALCWTWYESDEDDPSGYGGCWALLPIGGGASSYTHWLPANALPVPQEES